MKFIEQKIIESGFLDEHDKNVGGTLYTPVNNQKLTASAIADILSVELVPVSVVESREQAAAKAADRAGRISELESLSINKQMWGDWQQVIDDRIATLTQQDTNERIGAGLEE